MDGKGGMPSLRETLKGHLAAGHDLQLVLPKYDPFSDDDKPMFVPADKGFVLHFAPCRWLLPLKKLRVQARGKGDSIPFGFRWILNVTMLLGLTTSLMVKAMQVRRNGFVPQLVYAHNQYAALAGYLLGRWFKVPNVTRLYGTFLADLMNRPLVSLRYPTAVAGYLVPSALLICANDGTRGDEVARKFRIPDHRFRFWQNGVEPPSQPPQVTRADLVARFGLNLRLESRWAVSCSRLSYWKRIDRMLRALAVCRGTGVDCQLVVAGDGPEKENLHTLAAELKVSDQVVWLGAVAHDDIWALMNTADVFMLTNDVTNRCNPLYEAAWAGLPVVSVNDSSTSDLLHHRANALLTEKDDTETLGNLLSEICRDEQLRERLGQAQKKLSETFWTWEERMRVEVAELEKLVSGVGVMAGGR
ncbi:glycosyltransferase family 4 protein [Desulfoprunum benzoelyticum]|nr:glycosyltransferase family 4 protein [Desulfoprunum benzoelyticum]